MKSIKKEYIVLGLIIVLLLAYLALKKTDNVHYDIPKLETLEAGQLDKIDIVSKERTLNLVKKDDKWVISPKGYPVDEGKSKSIVDVVSSLTLTDLVSRAKNYTRYHLGDEKAIHVKAYNKDKVVRDFYIGKAASTYGHTFVKLEGNDYVYNARESFRNNFDVKTDDIRAKSVMKLDRNEITEVTLEKEGQTFQFARKVKAAIESPVASGEEKAETAAPSQKPENDISWVQPDGKKGQRSVIDSLLTQVESLDCQGYIESKTKDDFKSQTPIYTVKLKGSKDYHLTIYPKIEEEGDNKGKYPAISSENAYPFLLASYKADQIMKKPEDLLEKKTEDKK